ncbi:arsenate reductase [Brevundimonas sp. 1080]|uniref:arsenate reductase (glutaredoxin) n=1 Tax=Brevundimonas sp. 1080 TaxID=3156405 RepID=UPI003390BFC6
MTNVTIYHNPNCGTSRNTLAMILASGEEPEVIEYLDAGWTPELLRSLSTLIAAPLRELIRQKGTPAAELGLLEEGVSDDTIIDAMVEHPILVNRPIVVTSLGAALCRPSEIVLRLLANPPHSFVKEDGSLALLKKGR